MIKKIFIVLISVVAAVVGISFLLPSQIHVQRSILIEAPDCHVFAVLDGFGRFDEWSPWAAIDPEGTETVLSGPSHGVGARTDWSSDHPDVGSGSQEITASVPNQRIDIELVFEGQGASQAAYVIRDNEANTEVTWSFDMDAGLNPILRWMGVLAFDGMIGADYERGLGKLEALIEAEAGADWCDGAFDRVEVAAQRYLVTERSVSLGEHEAVAPTLGAAYGQLMTAIASAGAQSTDMPVVITRSLEQGQWTFDAAIPVADDLAMELGEDLGLIDGPVGQAVRLTHRGPYSGLSDANLQLEAMLQAHGFEPLLKWERYANDPTTVEPEAIVTELFALIE